MLDAFSDTFNEVRRWKPTFHDMGFWRHLLCRQAASDGAVFRNAMQTRTLPEPPSRDGSLLTASQPLALPF
jgi:hypothetical protein